MAKLSKLMEKFTSIPGLSKMSGLSVVAKLGRVPLLSKIPKPNKVPNPLKVPFIARIPLRTKLIFVAALVIILVSVPVMLSLGQHHNKQNTEQGAVTQEVAEVTDKTPTETPEEKPAEPTPSPEATPEETPNQALLQPDENEQSTPEPTSNPNVGGVLTEDTTWAKKDTPYVMTEPVRIPAGITLSIEPGVTITKQESANIECMFLLNGTLQAHGTVDAPIVFDGGGNASFFSPSGSGSGAFLDLDYCRIRNGISFWDSYGQFGAFNLKHSRLTNLSGPSYVWYPEQDIYIEYNAFRNAGGFSIEQRHNEKIYIQYNLFEGKSPSLPADADYWIQNRGSFNQSETIINYNSFSPSDKIALKLAPGHDAAAITATQNYWGTQDDNLIRGMIYDRTDDDTCAGYITYTPFLTEPDPNTPVN